MNIDIKTVVEGCAAYCPKFEIKVINLYANDIIINRSYRCEHLDECNAMIQAINTVTIDLKNIT